MVQGTEGHGPETRHVPHVHEKPRPATRHARHAASDPRAPTTAHVPAYGHVQREQDDGPTSGQVQASAASAQNHIPAVQSAIYTTNATSGATASHQCSLHQTDSISIQPNFTVPIHYPAVSTCTAHVQHDAPTKETKPHVPGDP